MYCYEESKNFPSISGKWGKKYFFEINYAQSSNISKYHLTDEREYTSSELRVPRKVLRRQ